MVHWTNKVFTSAYVIVNSIVNMKQRISMLFDNVQYIMTGLNITKPLAVITIYKSKVKSLLQ